MFKKLTRSKKNLTIYNLVKKYFGSFFLSLILFSLIISPIPLAFPPPVQAATDPGLNSGNATVDRTSVPGDTILIYQITGTSTFTPPEDVTDVRVLVVGGGAGGGVFGGGGGAGGVIANSSVAVTSSTPLTITVGAGGAGAVSRTVRGSNGSNSVFGVLTAVGGGGGGSDNLGTNTPSINDGANGGSGGGASNRIVAIGGTGTSGQGNNGADNGVGTTHGGGGGGAGGPGQQGTSTVNLTDGGDGGLSIMNDITGSGAAYAGGGGAQYGGSGGGAGAGNAAGANFTPGNDATVNTGSGGGGGANARGGNGGSGVVIVRFATQDDADNETTNSSTPSTSSCTDSLPTGIPNLFQISTTSTTAKLYFTPLLDTNKYYISYSTNSSAEDYGVEVQLGSDGVQQYNINDLQPGTTYNFKVRGQKGCAPGNWSNVKSSATIDGSSLLTSFPDEGPEIDKLIIESPESSSSTKPKQEEEEETVGDTHDVLIRVENEGQPLGGVAVELHSDPKYGTTDEEGEVLFEDVEKGEHTLKLAYQGKKVAQKVVVEGEEKEVEVTVNVTLEDSNPIPLWAWILLVLFLLLIIFILWRKRRRTSDHTLKRDR